MAAGRYVLPLILILDLVHWQALSRLFALVCQMQSLAATPPFRILPAVHPTLIFQSNMRRGRQRPPADAKSRPGFPGRLQIIPQNAKRLRFPGSTLFLDRSLGGGEAGDWHAAGRAGNTGEAKHLAIHD